MVATGMTFLQMGLARPAATLDVGSSLAQPTIEVQPVRRFTVRRRRLERWIAIGFGVVFGVSSLSGKSVLQEKRAIPFRSQVDSQGITRGLNRKCLTSEWARSSCSMAHDYALNVSKFFELAGLFHAKISRDSTACAD